MAAGIGLKPDAIAAWSNEGKLIDLAEARTKPLRCAAANWHALATWAATQHPIGVTLLIDIGSTTTDIVKMTGGRVEAAGLTDTQRLLAGELVYVGAQRTLLAALGPTIELNGSAYPLMAEYFATSADVFVLTGDQPEQPDSVDTCDGRPMTKEHAAGRVARMIGADMDMMTTDEATQLAHSFANVMHRHVAEAIVKVINVPNAPRTNRVVISGSGAFIAQAAVPIVLERTDVELLSQTIGEEASTCAPAYALGRLAETA